MQLQIPTGSWSSLDSLGQVTIFPSLTNFDKVVLRQQRATFFSPRTVFPSGHGPHANAGQVQKQKWSEERIWILLLYIFLLSSIQASKTCYQSSRTYSGKLREGANYEWWGQWLEGVYGLERVLESQRERHICHSGLRFPIPVFKVSLKTMYN